jgi:hypothetical protein
MTPMPPATSAPSQPAVATNVMARADKNGERRKDKPDGRGTGKPGKAKD